MKPTTHAASSGRVFYLGKDQGLTTELSPALESKGLRLLTFARTEELLRETAEDPPEVLMLDLSELSGPGGLSQFITRLDDALDRRPQLICIASRERGEDSLEYRLAARRAGADSYLVAPLTVRRLASRILRMCGILETTRYRILLVLRDAGQARKIATLLASIGMETLVVEDPMKLLARMQAFRPNLILMDLQLAEFSGAELAAIIRDHDEFFGTPILFLSSETDLGKQLDALKAGGDGFIAKPVRRADLIAAVEYRMRMSRWLQDRHTLVNRRETPSGFLPRDVFMRHLERLIRAGEASNEGHGLLLIELDAHKTLLERLGLAACEKLLRNLELLIGRNVNAEESATRLDDFRYALLAKRESVQQIEALADRLCAQIRELEPLEQDRNLAVTISVGVGLFRPAPDDAFTLVSRGEKALTSANLAGGNRVHVWSPATTAGGTESASVLKRLVVTALAQNGLRLLFQPILSLNNHEDEFYEALIRLRTLDGEEIPPGDFLSVAERAELMPRVDRWVLRQTLEIMSTHRVSHPRLRLLVHQNVMTLAAPEWFPWLRDQLIQDRLARIYPLLEFQMSDVRQHRGEAKTLIERLRQYGIQVCVANVAATREEVSMLGRLGVALAKLSFQIVRTTEQAQLTEMIQSLRTRGVGVIAPGIDDEESLSRVWGCRPDFIQGNYLQMPGPDLNFDFQRVSHDD